MVSRAVLFERFSGREEELAHLRQFRAQTTRDGVGGAVLVRGEAGIGKSRLLGEFGALIRNERGSFVYVRCEENAPAYGPLLETLDALRPKARRHGREVLERAREALTLPDAVVVADAGEQRSARLGRLRAAIESELRLRGPLTLAFDDAHHADPTAFEALRVLVALAKRSPLMLVIAYRSEEVERDLARANAIAALEREGVDRIGLEPLERRELSTALRRILPKTQRATLDRICELSDGRPYVAEELARSVIETPQGDVAPTFSLRGSVLGRLRQLDETARTIVRRAAVIGHTFNAEDLADAAGTLEEAARALLVARDLQLLKEAPEEGDEAYRFRHALTREIVYEDTSEGERRALHLAFAERLRARDLRRPPLAEIAHHLGAAGDSEAARLAWERAGDEAFEIAAFDDALRFYERCITLAGAPIDERVRLGRKVMNAADALGRIETIAGLAQDLAQALIAAGREIDAFELRVAALRLIARYRSPHVSTLAAVVEATFPDCRGRVAFEAHVALAFAKFMLSQFVEMTASIERASLAVQPPDAYQQGELLHLRHLVAFHYDMDFDLCVTLLPESIELARNAGDHRRLAIATYHLALNHRMRGDFDAARAPLLEARELFTRYGFAGFASRVDGARAQFAAFEGDFAGAERILATLPDDEGYDFGRDVARATLFLARGGDRETFLASFERALAARMVNLSIELAKMLAWTAATPDEARAHLRKILAISEGELNDSEFFAAVAEFGDDAEVARVRELAAASPDPAQAFLRRVDRLMFTATLAKREARTLAARDAAHEGLELSRGRNLWWPTLVFLRILGRTEEAREYAMAIGATAAAERLGAPAAADPVVLTARQQQIIRGLVAGLGNREIAENLGIGPRTVETHLVSLYRKHGVRTRAQLAARYLRP